jgi:hypothetical protein
MAGFEPSTWQAKSLRVPHSTARPQSSPDRIYLYSYFYTHLSHLAVLVLANAPSTRTLLSVSCVDYCLGVFIGSHRMLHYQAHSRLIQDKYKVD